MNLKIYKVIGWNYNNMIQTKRGKGTAKHKQKEKRSKLVERKRERKVRMSDDF